MNSHELYIKIKDRNAYELFRTIKCQLRTLPPNGATNHKLRNLLEGFGISVSAYERGIWPKEETFEQYQNRTCAKRILESILTSIEKFNVIL